MTKNATAVVSSLPRIANREATAGLGPTGADKKLFDARELYDVYRCTIVLRDKICGGTPKKEDVLADHVRRTTGHDDDLTIQQIAAAKVANKPKADLDDMVDVAVEEAANGFPADERGIFIWCRQVKALFKECATMLRVTTTKIGSKQIFQHGFEIKGPDMEDRLYLGKTAADGTDEGPVHVMTPQGPRTAIKRVDFCLRPRLSFEIWVLHTEGQEKRHVGEEEIKKMLAFGQENGLGADRSQGRGKFDVVEFERVK